MIFKLYYLLLQMKAARKIAGAWLDADLNYCFFKIHISEIVSY